VSSSTVAWPSPVTNVYGRGGYGRYYSPRDAMKLLNFLVESFIGGFGITRPKPEQQRTVALALGGFLLIFFAALFSLIGWMLFGVRR
jgi:hypothetical protein